MARLRGPDGCPWDRAQDFDSVKGLLLEEAYEVVDAVSAHDFDALEDELGDLLFQVVFYARMAEEENRFTIDGVIERIHAKLVRRHPHVFGPTHAHTPEEALASWNAVKETERRADSKNGFKSLLDGIATALPSTLDSYELGMRAAEAGFDWEKAEDILDKIEEELRELRQELKASQSGRSAEARGRIEEEIGDLMFATANLARFLHSDAEVCLRRANRKFVRRFQELEREVEKRGRKVRECSAADLNAIWEEVKRREAR